MSLDITTLSLLKERENYERIARAIPARALDTATRVVLADFGRYFRETPGATAVDFAQFQTLFKLWHPSLDDAQLAAYGEVFKQVALPPNATLAEGLLNRLHETAAAAELAELAERYANGEDVNLTDMLSRMAERLQDDTGRQVDDPQCRDSFEEILAEKENDTGLQFRLECLNKSVRPLVGGDFVIVGARVDTGKTTLLASEVCWMARQMDQLWPGQQRSVLWLVNEGHPRRTVERTLQAALGADLDELIAWAKDGTLRQRYVEALGGRGGALRIFGIHDMTMGEIEHKIIRKHRPGVIVYDMLDNVKFDGDVSNGGQRTDQLLEAMYQRARVQAVKYDCPVFATSQLNSEAEGIPWPTLSMLANGRTGKPGTADLIIMLAKAADPTMDGMRFVSTPKNKLKRKGAGSTLRAEVVFQADRAILTDAPGAP